MLCWVRCLRNDPFLLQCSSKFPIFMLSNLNNAVYFRIVTPNEFRMLYRRRSPRLIVRHSVEGSFRPVSVMYEENALDGLSTLFADDPNVFTSVSFSQILAFCFTGSEHTFYRFCIIERKSERKQRPFQRWTDCFYRVACVREFAYSEREFRVFIQRTDVFLLMSFF